MKIYRFEPESFEYQMKPLRSTYAYNIYQLKFPSPYVSEITENNMVYCEYFRRPDDKAHAAVILLDIMDGSLIVSRLIAHTLASNGIDACIMIMPHYGPRRSADPNKKYEMLANEEFLIQSIQQAVMDVRRTARCLAGMEMVDKNRIGICGTSLGGFVTVLAAGVDGQFKRAAIIIGGADLAEAITSNAEEVKGIRAAREEKGITAAELKEKLRPIEPLSFADRMKGSKVLMVNAIDDPIVPAEGVKKLAAAINTEVKWYPTDHYGMIQHLLPVLEMVRQHFSGETW